MNQRIVTLVGGSGFVGRYAVKILARAGYRLRIVSRRPDAAQHLKTAGDVGQIALTAGDIAQPESLAGKLDGSFAVVNLVGVMTESGRQTFTGLHAQGAEKLAKLARAAGAERFIQVSALGVDKAAGAHYARSKALGEKAVLAAFSEATILRPGVLFGPEDDFFNRFARMAMFSPALPLVGGGQMRFQPVYVGDVAAAIAACLTRDDAKGQTYELGGPHVFTFREILDYMLRTTGRRRALVPLPFALASMLAPLMQYLPPPFTLTPDQVRLLHHDNMVSPGAKTFAQLGITPTAIDMVAPEYLARFRKHTA